MTRKLLVHGPAAADLRRARAWYEQQRTGLGRQFTGAVDDLLRRIGENPFQYPTVHRGVRRAVLRRFPYLLYFEVQENAILLLGCLHGRRDPAWIRARFDEPPDC